jgi:hypothetical protein
LSNCRSYQEFRQHFAFVVEELFRVTLPGRLTAVHCMDIPNAKSGGFDDFPGDLIRLHREIGWIPWCRHHVWKEPLGVRNRTMARGLAHRQIVEDSTLCDVASADQLLIFRKPGENPIPVEHPNGLMDYAGERRPPADVLSFRGWEGKQTENRYSHWIWRQYASAFWDDIRIDRVLPYKESRDPEDERHVHALQLDVIERAVVMRSNPGEIVLSPFMGVGSEVYGAVVNDRRGIGIELKPSYYRQAVANLAFAVKQRTSGVQGEMFETPVEPAGPRVAEAP